MCRCSNKNFFKRKINDISKLNPGRIKDVTSSHSQMVKSTHSSLSYYLTIYTKRFYVLLSSETKMDKFGYNGKINVELFYSKITVGSCKHYLLLKEARMKTTLLILEGNHLNNSKEHCTT